MCSPAICNTCGKTTWAGCGNHIDEALAGVPADKQCTCDTVQAAQSAFARIFTL